MPFFTQSSNVNMNLLRIITIISDFSQTFEREREKRYNVQKEKEFRAV